MQERDMKLIFQAGNAAGVALIHCKDGISEDTYRTVCAFLNRYGGSVYLGVEAEGSICGLEARTVPGLLKEFMRTVSSPELLSPPVFLMPKIMAAEGKTIIEVQIPVSPSVHSYRNVIYDRAQQKNIPVRTTREAAVLYARKQAVYTEQRIFPCLTKEHLRMDLLPRVREMALRRHGGTHPWGNMEDDAIIRSAGLYGEDYTNGGKGYNLAAALLLGRDSTIMSVCPGYRTDAIARSERRDRNGQWDSQPVTIAPQTIKEHCVIQTNLIESYDRLTDFAHKHLDKNYGNDGTDGISGTDGGSGIETGRADKVSLRNGFINEVIVNMLTHREFSSAYIARFIVGDEWVIGENANRPLREDPAAADCTAAYPKNPIIAGFFRNIGLADQTGYGMEKLTRYSRQYSGREALVTDGDIFRVMVPLEDACSRQGQPGEKKVGGKREQRVGINRAGRGGGRVGERKLTGHQEDILCALREEPSLSARELSGIVGISSRKIEENIRKLKAAGLLFRLGSPKKGYWKVKD